MGKKGNGHFGNLELICSVYSLFVCLFFFCDFTDMVSEFYLEVFKRIQRKLV